jgi:hypothetical protein
MYAFRKHKSRLHRYYACNLFIAIYYTFFFSNAFLLFFHFQLKEEKNFTFITKIGIMYNMLVESINQRLASSIAENKFIY